MTNLPLNDTGGKFATNTANLPPVWQIMGTLSDCRHLKVNLKRKFNYMLTRLHKGVKKKFWLNIFWFVTGVNDTGGAPWRDSVTRFIACSRILVWSKGVFTCSNCFYLPSRWSEGGSQHPVHAILPGGSVYLCVQTLLARQKFSTVCCTWLE